MEGPVGGRAGGSKKVDGEFVTKLGICGNFWYIHKVRIRAHPIGYIYTPRLDEP